MTALSKTAIALEKLEVRMSYTRARDILRNVDDYELDTIDAAFDALIHSADKEDQLLCEAAVKYMWEVPKPNLTIFLVVVSAVATVAVSLAAILSELIQ